MLERTRSLWTENGSFHSLTFNAIATNLNVAEMVTIVVILGLYHAKLSYHYYWWPIVEGVRVFCLTVARCDVLLKVDDHESNVNDIENENASSRFPSDLCTRRSLFILNMAGLVWLIVGVPIYVLLMPNLGYTDVSIVFTTLAIVILLVRLALSVPLVILVCGGSDFTIHDGVNYERIADVPVRDSSNSADSISQSPVYTQPHAFPGSFDRRASGLTENEINSIQRALAAEAMEDRQIEAALEASRKESYQSLREEQDEEYRRTLDEHLSLRASIAESDFSLANPTAGVSFPSTLGAGTTPGSTLTGATTLGGDEEDLEEDVAPFDLEMDDEPAASGSTVVVRIRLPNGTRLQRRFTRYDCVEDIRVWVKIELWKNKMKDIVEAFQLVSTMPRHVYDDHSATLEHLKFWVPNSKRECITGMIYVEEL